MTNFTQLEIVLFFAFCAIVYLNSLLSRLLDEKTKDLAEQQEIFWGLYLGTPEFQDQPNGVPSVRLKRQP